MTSLTVALMVASWILWLATLGGVLWLRTQNQKLWKLTKVGFIASTVANCSITLANCWMLNSRP